MARFRLILYGMAAQFPHTLLVGLPYSGSNMLDSLLADLLPRFGYRIAGSTEHTPMLSTFIRNYAPAPIYHASYDPLATFLNQVNQAEFKFVYFYRHPLDQFVSEAMALARMKNFGPEATRESISSGCSSLLPSRITQHVQWLQQPDESCLKIELSSFLSDPMATLLNLLRHCGLKEHSKTLSSPSSSQELKRWRDYYLESIQAVPNGLDEFGGPIGIADTLFKNPEYAEISFRSQSVLKPLAEANARGAGALDCCSYLDFPINDPKAALPSTHVMHRPFKSEPPVVKNQKQTTFLLVPEWSDDQDRWQTALELIAQNRLGSPNCRILMVKPPPEHIEQSALLDSWKDRLDQRLELCEHPGAIDKLAEVLKGVDGFVMTSGKSRELVLEARSQFVDVLDGRNLLSASRS